MNELDITEQYRKDITTLSKKYNGQLSAQEAIEVLITTGTCCALLTAPSHIEGLNFILKCVSLGIETFEEGKLNEKENE